MAKRYRQRHDGRFFRVPIAASTHVMCCDCGLTHKFRFRIGKGRRVYMAAWRDDDETGRVRHRYARKLTCGPVKART